MSIAATSMVACTSNTKSSEAEEAKVINADTVGLAAFQQWKMQNELKEAAEYQAYLDQKNNPAPAPVVKRKTSTASSSSGSMSSSSSNAAKAEEKKGWSKAAKGATIGGIAGGAAGAIINKRNRVVGGGVGAVAGAGLGYVIGRHLDKKDGRY